MKQWKKIPKQAQKILDCLKENSFIIPHLIIGIVVTIVIIVFVIKGLIEDFEATMSLIGGLATIWLILPAIAIAGWIYTSVKDRKK